LCKVVPANPTPPSLFNRVKLPKTFLAVNLSDAFTFQEKQNEGETKGEEQPAPESDAAADRQKEGKTEGEGQPAPESDVVDKQKEGETEGEERQPASAASEPATNAEEVPAPEKSDETSEAPATAAETEPAEKAAS
jgi:inositol hexakisphosphate/diphosphoinositol-pentakisphosphate kinase